MLSFKLLGFIKQAIVASYYGATIDTDIYFIAWGFASGISEAIVKALGVSLVAIYTSTRIREGKLAAAKLINGLVELLLPIFAIVGLLMFFTAPIMSRVLASTYDNDSLSKLSVYISILSPIQIFSAVELIFGSVFDSHKKFFIPRTQNLIYSVAVIVCCVFLSGILGIHALILAQYISNILFTLLLLIKVKEFHQFFWTRIKESPEIRNVIITAIPLIIGCSALQLNQIIDKSITSSLGDGATSALSYCHTIEQFVTNIMIVNIGNVLFANFAEFTAKNEINTLSTTLSRAINVVVVVLLGIMGITLCCAKDIVSTVYFRGSFTEEAVKMTSLALVGYSFSFISVAVRDFTVKCIYSFKDTKRPMIASMTAIAINITLSVILSRIIGILGVSLATSISAIVSMTMDAIFLKRYIKDYSYAVHAKKLFRCLPSLTLMVVTSISINYCLVDFNYVLRFFVSASISMFVYFGSLFLFRNEELLYIVEKAKNKLSSAKK